MIYLGDKIKFFMNISNFKKNSFFIKQQVLFGIISGVIKVNVLEFFVLVLICKVFVSYYCFFYSGKK